VYTSSYDCTIRSLSFTSGVSREIYASDDGALITSIDLPPTGHEMWLSDSQGGATHLDLREDQRKACWYGLSDQKIGCVSINPTRPHFLLASSNSRSLKWVMVSTPINAFVDACRIRIWDVRNLQHMIANLSDDTLAKPPQSPTNGNDGVEHSSHEFDAATVTEFLGTKEGKTCLRAEWRHDKSVSSAYWDPRGRAIVSTSYDDNLRCVLFCCCHSNSYLRCLVWDIESSRFESSSSFPSSRPFSRLKHNCQTVRIFSMLHVMFA
jgi:WD40 repeat protein